jgi:zinc protease
MALRPVRFPPFVNGRLPNGISTLVVEKHEQPVVTITLALPAGSFYEPGGKAGLASLVASLLTKGTERRTADQLSAEIEGAGGSIGANADDDFLTLTVSGLSTNAEQLFNLLGDVVQHASFPAAEVDLARTQALSALQLELSQPASIAGRIFGHEIYGDHPYGRSQTPASLRGLTREDVVAFYGSRVKPTGALLVVAGDLTPARVASLAAASLGSWNGAAAAPAAPAAIPVRTASEIVLVHKAGAVQSNIVAGFPFITPRDPAYYALNLMNRVLGGGADSRLFMVLREQHGWTYGAYSGFSRPKGVGAFQATAEVRTEVTDSALAELVRQLDRMRTQVPADSEIAAARNYLVGRFPLTIETADDIAGRVAGARLLGLPDDYVLRYRERLSAVTKVQLAAAARRYLTTDRMVIVVVGDGQRILAGLKAQGLPVRIVDTEGHALAEADLAPHTAPGFAVDRVSAGTNTYRIMFNGNAFGSETRTVSRVQVGGRDAWQVITSDALGPVGRQDDTTVAEVATLRPISVRQSGTLQGQQVFVRLDYAGGRVRGASRSVGAGGIEEHQIDTTVTDATLDDNVLALTAVAAPYAAGAHWTVPVFEGGKGALAQVTVSVTGEESVTVPAGTFACWKVDITGGQQPVTMYVTKEAPYMTVKLEITGAPVAMELVSRTQEQR